MSKKSSVAKNLIGSVLSIVTMKFIMSMLSIVTGMDVAWVKPLAIVMLLCWYILLHGLVKANAYKDYQLKKNNDIRRRSGSPLNITGGFQEHSIKKGAVTALLSMSISIVVLILFNIFGADWMRLVVVGLNFIYLVPFINFFGLNNPNLIIIGMVLQFAIFFGTYIFEGYRQKIIYENIMSKNK